MSTFSYASNVLDIAANAGALIMEYYIGEKDMNVQKKADNSPVTAADIEANQYIVEALNRLTPGITVIAEENEEQGTINSGSVRQMFWLVDPLDGTKSFINKSGDFTVNIGLIEFGKPVFGVIFVPAKQLCYFVGADGKAYRRDAKGETQLSVRQASSEGVDVVASKSHHTPETDNYINTLKVKSLISAASSLKFCLVAEGSADIYPRFGRTMEWDTAAGHAILLAAGGKVETLDGKNLTYGKSDFANDAFIARGK